MALNEIYPDPKDVQVNVITVPVEAFLALTRAIREIRAIHYRLEGFSDPVCATCQTMHPCETIKTLETFEKLGDK